MVSSSADAGDGAGAVGSSVIGSWAVEAPPPPEEEGWSPGQATYASNSFMLMMDGKPNP